MKAAAGRGRFGAALTRTRAGWYYVTARVDRGDFGQELYMRGMEPLRLDFKKIQNTVAAPPRLDASPALVPPST